MKLLTLIVIEGVAGVCDVFQLVICFLSLGQFVVFINEQVIVQAIIVGAVVVNVQLAEAVDQRQVTVAVESAHIVGAERDQVEIIDIAQRGSGIAVDGGGIGKEVVTTLGDVSAGKDGVVDGDAVDVKVLPLIFVVVPVLQFVQILHRHILAR